MICTRRILVYTISLPKSKNITFPKRYFKKFLPHTCHKFPLRYAVKRHFHFSSVQKAIHPLLFVILRPLSQIGAILFGRAFRKWWKGLPKEQQREYIERFLRNRHKLLTYSLSFVVLVVLYYYYHVENCPHTNRKRFITVTKNQYAELCKIQYELLMSQVKPYLLPDSDYRVRHVKKITERLLVANSDIDIVKDIIWKVHVVDLPIRNAMVIPNGCILVFTGMFKDFTNDDQLGIVLGHEMTHAILGHGMEQMSWTQLVDSLMIILIAAVWALVPAFSAALVHFLSYNIAEIMTHLPNSRRLEVEADDFGLILAAKACFDPREVYAFWIQMMMKGKIEGDVKLPDFVLTHPNHGDRAARLEPSIEKALRLRAELDCPRLKSYDPRVLADVKRDMIERQLATHRRVL